MTVVPSWLRGYDRAWLRPDVIAGAVIWSVVTPQAVAYAQIAGLPPEAGLVAAPAAMLGYALLGSSRTLVVSATTATSALSAAAVGPLADGDAARFAALSAALALVSAAVLVAAGLARFGGIADLVSKPVVTGFLFGLGLLITVGQLPSLLGVPPGEGDFFPQVADLIGELGDAHGPTVAVGAASVAALVAFKRLAPRLPGTLIVLAGAIACSALLGLDDRGVAVIGELPDALPDPAVPDVGVDDLVALLPAALGVIIVSTEAVSVARALATQDGYAIDVNRELVALGGANAITGLTSGFVQSGGASQTAAAQNAGGRSQLASVIAAVLILLTGAFLSPVFTDLPQATLGAIVIVAVAGFWRVSELRRFARVRRTALVFALLALAGVLLLGVLEGLVVTALLSLAVVVKHISRPEVAELARDPESGAWGRMDRHPGWARDPRALVARIDGPLFYANGVNVKDQLLALVARAPAPPAVLVLELDQSDADLETADTLAELTGALAAKSVELRLGAVRAPVQALLERARVADHVRIAPTVDAAIEEPARERSGDE